MAHSRRPSRSPAGRRGSGVLALSVAFLLSACGPSPEDLYSGELPERVDFNFHVKPILSDNCFACHGPDEAALEAGLRLDTREGLRKVTKGGLLGRSELLRRITASDPREVMPPKDSHLALSPYEMALLARWVEQGAEWKPHWAFIPPEKPSLPEVRDDGWARTPIDRIVLARLEREGLKPAPEAEKERLIRRVTYDLTGLPPTVEEVERFREDRSADAYEKVVDRLLASPAYGERMATEWLDLARYADSHGYEHDRIRPSWRWRDWVVEAFNRNQPYDEFATWQLAGDLLPDATREQILATGFGRNHSQNDEGGIIDEEFRVEYVADRTNTFGTAFLGLTMECARCHTHKYDPISHREYYQLFAFFNNNDDRGIAPVGMHAGPTLLLPDEEEERKLDAARRKIRERERALAEYVAQVRKEGEHLRGLDGLRLDPSRGLVAHLPFDALTDGRSENLAAPDRPARIHDGEASIAPGKLAGALEILDFGVMQITDGYVFERTDPFSLGVWVLPARDRSYAPILSNAAAPGSGARGYELALRDNRVAVSLAHLEPSDAIRIRSEAALPAQEWSHVMVAYDGSGRAAGIQVYINGRRVPVEVETDQLRRTILTGARLRFGRKMTGKRDAGNLEGGRIDEVRIYDRMLSPLEVAGVAGLRPLDAIRGRAADQLSEDDRAALLAHHLHTRDAEYAERLEELRNAREEENRLISGVEDVMVMRERPQPRATHVLERGVYDSPAERVDPGTPESVLPFPDSLPRDRLGLARWLFSPDHPLTARVAVNRYWQMLFGTGLVKTADDFGNQGDIPVHPELLDWLAVSYQESGWDTKALLKGIVMSSTYRQSSRANPELMDRDPENRLLARGPSNRLPAEMIRDGALATSGLLVRKIGGPPVYPYQPEGLWESVATRRGIEYIQGTGEDLYRRSVYTIWRRANPPTQLSTFDAPSRGVCTVSRQQTNTPLQALVLLNDPQIVEAARLLAERMMKEGGGSLDDRLRFGFQVTTSRKPSERETESLRSLYRKQLAGYRASPALAGQLLRVGEHPRDESLDPVDAAAYTMVAKTLLNLDESIHKR